MEYLSRARVNCLFNLKLDFIYKRTKRKKERDRSLFLIIIWLVRNSVVFHMPWNNSNILKGVIGKGCGFHSLAHTDHIIRRAHTVGVRWQAPRDG
ncbi:hypothetical protein E1A91_D12G301800v1 [Gossypium mustelinum]|uniref:Uncharacterized protein n=1 Tax=Gossypium mustelinum TaxID=34275 RepID=A0A5D2SMP9_GOSMU|nr:hypothetical protein E1A91_D12G301800v1 [Gossypium mustelinum]